VTEVDPPRPTSPTLAACAFVDLTLIQAPPSTIIVAVSCLHARHPRLHKLHFLAQLYSYSQPWRRRRLVGMRPCTMPNLTNTTSVLDGGTGFLKVGYAGQVRITRKISRSLQ
jgi:hypothetical protein